MVFSLQANLIYMCFFYWFVDGVSHTGPPEIYSAGVCLAVAPYLFFHHNSKPFLMISWANPDESNMISHSSSLT